MLTQAECDAAKAKADEPRDGNGARGARVPSLDARPSDAPFLGVGVGLRPLHIRKSSPTRAPAQLGVDFFEALSENYMVPGGRPLRVLDEVRARVPLVLHGVSLNLGSTDPLDAGYLDDLAALAARRARLDLRPPVLDGSGGHNLHDLLPLPYTEEALAHVVERMRRVQDRLGRRIAIENVSSYFAYRPTRCPSGSSWRRSRSAPTAGSCST